MAEAPGHLLGQIIGNVVEEAIRPRLKSLADEHDLYLDAIGPRPGVRDGRKVTWTDAQGNRHDLDFVLERGGSARVQGAPAAFVESAWRRYTKHSKAKAQEISGALDPLLLTHATVKPVGSAVVAGEWSRPALEQLRSNGYLVLHVGFETVRSVFAGHNIDIAGQGERTPDSYWQRQCDTFHELERKADLAQDLRDKIAPQLTVFIADLEEKVVRKIRQVRLLPLYGRSENCGSIAEALEVLSSMTSSDSHDCLPFIRFEVHVVYDNGDSVRADFGSSLDAAKFLETFE